MKKIILVWILVVPVICLWGWPSQFMQNQGNLILQNRSWHVTEELKESKENGEWHSIENAVYHYNQINPVKIDSFCVFSYHEESSSWENLAVARFTYQPQTDYFTSMETFFMTETGYTPFMKAHFYYDELNRIHLWVVEVFNENQWQLMNRTQITLVSDTEFYADEWNAADENDPALFRKGTFDTDDFGRINGEHWIASTDSTNWVNDQYRIRVFHPHDTSTIQWFLQNLARTMALSIMSDNHGPSFGMVLNETEMYWNGTDWENERRTEWGYNEQDVLNGIWYFQWDNSTWMNTEETYFLYNDNQLVSQEVECYFDGNIWNESDRKTYTWSEYVGITDIALPVFTNSLKTYPNPFVDQCAMELNNKISIPLTVQVFNIKGQLIRTLLIKDKIIWDGKDDHAVPVSAGIYLIKIKGDHEYCYKKILKVK